MNHTPPTLNPNPSIPHLGNPQPSVIPLISRLLASSPVSRLAHRAGSSLTPHPGSVSLSDLPPGSWEFMEGLSKCSVNYVPLTPISFLERASRVYGDRTSILHESTCFTWSETHHRSLKLASSLSLLGISYGDVVATLTPNIPAMYELHFAAPMAGAILCTLNTRLDPSTISVLLSHSEARILFVDHEFLNLAQAALDLLPKTGAKQPILVLVKDDKSSSSSSSAAHHYEYEDLVNTGDIEFTVKRPRDEWDPITLNYTSGTTSRPKGVVYSHRGAYLNAIATSLIHGMTHLPTYLWTVPMFHANGWCLPWGVAAFGGTNICTRKVRPEDIFHNIVQHKVTDMTGAPTVLNMIVNSPVTDHKPLSHRVRVMTGGSPPPPQILHKMESLGFDIIHIYGLTETYGPGTCCFWKPEWDGLEPNERSVMKSRQGMENLAMEGLEVKDPVTMESVPSDGETIGEVMFRGNTVMSGYYKDVKATHQAFAGGWFRTGDLAVRHPDGYIQIKDRSKDIIISGGENISTAEVERVMYNHPAVMEVAVVARPDEHWGQTPCAFVKLMDGFQGVTTPDEIIEFCRTNLAHYMCPKTVLFEEELPKTATGKIQKFVLREKAKALGSLT